MALRLFLSLFFIGTIVSSCATERSTYWVSREQLVPAAQPNIKSLELVDGKVLKFDRNLGWFDAEHGVVEGVTITGWHPVISLDRVKRAEVTEGESKGLDSTGFIVLGISLLGILAAIATTRSLGSPGCLVLIGFFGIGATAASIVLLV